MLKMGLKDLYIEVDSAFEETAVLQYEFINICKASHIKKQQDEFNDIDYRDVLNRVKAFLDLHPNFDPQYQNYLGLTPVHYLASRGMLSSLEYLVGKYPAIKLDVQSDQDWTPLTNAAYFGQLSVMQFLIANGANPKSLLPGNKTLLHITSYQMFPDINNQKAAFVQLRKPIVDYLIELGIDPNALDNNGRSYQAVLAYEPLEDQIKNLRIVDPIGWTYLHLAAHLPSIRSGAAIDKLLSNKQLVQKTDDYDRSPLMYAVMMGAENYFTRLLPLSDAFAKEMTGKTVLHFAVTKSTNVNIVKALLKMGLDPFEKDKHGKTAIDIAFECGCKDILKTLQNVGLRKILSEKRGDTVEPILIELNVPRPFVVVGGEHQKGESTVEISTLSERLAGSPKLKHI